MSAPRVSIVIPTYNGAATLPAVLEAIQRQQVDFDFEVVAVDSGSTDGTVPLLESRVQHLIEIPNEQFNHGLSRNLGIEKARGDLAVLLVQDAMPADDHWLSHLTAPLFGDSGLAGTFGRQQPRPDASRITRRMLSRWVAAGDRPYRSRLTSAKELSSMAPEQRLRVCAFDNVCSCLSRDVWKDYPFPSAPFAEDLEWAQKVLLAGYEIAFVPAAAVFHSHDRSIAYELKRTIMAHRRLFELFELRTIPTFGSLWCSWIATFGDHMNCLISEPGPRPGLGEILRTLCLVKVWPLGQYLGGRAGANDRMIASRGEG